MEETMVHDDFWSRIDSIDKLDMMDPFDSITCILNNTYLNKKENRIKIIKKNKGSNNFERII